MNNVDQIVEAISDQIIEAVNTANNSTKFERCMVEKVNTDGTVAIRYQNRSYNTKVLNGTTLSVGQTVIVCIPDNKIEKRFILGKI